MPAAPLRVVVDAFALTDGSEFRGIGTVLHHVLPGLAADERFHVVALARPSAALPDGVERRPIRRHDLRPRLADIEHEMLLPRDVRRAAGDVFWSPGTHPPRRVAGPFVQTIHDLTPLYRPDPLLAHEAKRWQRSGASVRSAHRVVTDSRSSADQAIAHLGVSPERIEVVPLGVDPAFSPGPGATRAPYVLYVGSWGPHKGLQEALAVLDILAERGHPHRLAIVGQQDRWMAARVAELVGRAAHADRVDVLGWVDDLVSLYRGAAALVFTSRAEGFGLPVVEAFACGTPVVAFANTSVPEVAGDAALLVDDGDTAAFADGIQRVLETPSLAEELEQAGLRRASAFRWDDTVRSYGEILSAVGAAG